MWWHNKSVCVCFWNVYIKMCITSYLYVTVSVKLYVYYVVHLLFCFIRYSNIRTIHHNNGWSILTLQGQHTNLTTVKYFRVEPALKLFQNSLHTSIIILKSLYYLILDTLILFTSAFAQDNYYFRAMKICSLYNIINNKIKIS